MGPGPAERDNPGDDYPGHDDRVAADRAAGHPRTATAGDAPDTVLEARARRRSEVAAALPEEVEHPAEQEGPVSPAGDRRGETWRRRSAVGALLTGIALGLGEVLEAERNEPAIIQETSGVPPRDLPVEADLGEASPKRSVVHVRPWLLGETAVPTGSRPASGAGGPGAGPGTADGPGDQPPGGPVGPSGPVPSARHPAPGEHRAARVPTPVPARAPLRRRIGRRR